ncbi:MAG: WG repeat-containing protein [Muribaculaceae bacterium]|nr:WG repeat-containing protein [Muribaculaceae bacterium]
MMKDDFNTHVPNRRFNENGLEGVVDPNGRVIVPAKYSRVKEFHRFNLYHAFAITLRDGRSFLLSDKGTEIFSADEIIPAGVKCITPVLFRKGDKWGLAGNAGDIILPAIYDSIQPDLDIFWTTKDGKWGLTDATGHIVEPVFDAVEADEKHRAVVIKDGCKYFLNKNLDCVTDTTDCVQSWLFDEE